MTDYKRFREFSEAATEGVLIEMIDELERLQDLESRIIGVLARECVPPTDSDGRELFLDERVDLLAKKARIRVEANERVAELRRLHEVWGIDDEYLAPLLSLLEAQ